MPPLTMYLVRHGQTLFNERDLVQGWVDSPLTALGLAQARRTGAELAGRSFAGAYSSTSERCTETAAHVLEHHPGLEVRLHRGLKELHFGELEGRPNPEFLAGIDPVTFFPEMLGGRGPGAPGGESGEVYRRRVDAAVTDILAAHPDGGDVLVVSHGVTIATILATFGWGEPGALPNASISVVSFEDGAGRFVAAGLESLAQLPFALA